MNPALQRLDALVGEWTLRASLDGRVVATGRMTVEWLEDAFLLQRAEADPPPPGIPPAWIEHSPFPTAAIVGLDDSSEAYTSLYADARGVCRVMQMTFDGTVWRLWRDAPGFFQRYEGRLAGDGRTVTGAWERSPDGVDWQHDFDLVYERAG